MSGTNAATRVLYYLKRAQQIEGTAGMTPALLQLFECREPLQARDSARVAVAKSLVLLRQLDMVFDACQNLGYRDGMYVSQVARVRDAFSPSALNQPFNHVTQRLGSDVIVAFEWLSHSLPDDESEFSLDELQQLLADVESLRDDEKLAQLPEHLREFVTRHLDDILSALRDYQLAGAQPLGKAVKSLILDAATDPIDTASVSDLSVGAKMYLQDVGAGFSKTIKFAATAGVAAEGIQKTWTLLSGSFGWLETVLKISN